MKNKRIFSNLLFGLAVFSLWGTVAAGADKTLVSWVTPRTGFWQRDEGKGVQLYQYLRLAVVRISWAEAGNSSPT